MMAPTTVYRELSGYNQQATYGADQRKPAVSEVHRRDRCGHELGEQYQVILLNNDVNVLELESGLSPSCQLWYDIRIFVFRAS